MVKGTAAELVPLGISIDDALRCSSPLARLRERIDGSNRRYTAILDLLPGSLAAAVRPGPLDDDGGWTLLADNAAAAAKLRQLRPRVERRLADALAPATVGAIRVRIARERPPA